MKITYECCPSYVVAAVSPLQQIVVNLVSSTRTNEGLEVHCWLDGNTYQKGQKITDKEIGSVRLKRNSFHGDWNYEIQPQEQSAIR